MSRKDGIDGRTTSAKKLKALETELAALFGVPLEQLPVIPRMSVQSLALLSAKLASIRHHIANGWPEPEELLRVQQAIDNETGHVEAMARAFRETRAQVAA